MAAAAAFVAVAVANASAAAALAAILILSETLSVDSAPVLSFKLLLVAVEVTCGNNSSLRLPFGFLPVLYSLVSEASSDQ